MGENVWIRSAKGTMAVDLLCLGDTGGACWFSVYDIELGADSGSSNLK